MDSTLLYVDLYKGGLCSTANGSSYYLPTITAGGKLVYSIRFIESIGGIYQQVYPAIASLRMAMGFVDLRPTKGTCKLKADSSVSSPANTTTALGFGANAAAVQTALNALSITGSDPFVVFDVSGGYVVKRTSGTSITLSIVENTLIPICFGSVEPVVFSGIHQYEVRLRQTPLAFSDTGVAIVPPEPKITRIQAGGNDGTEGGAAWSEIQALTISAAFQGTYQIRRGFEKAILLDITDGPTQLQDALNAMLATEGGSVVVTNPTTNTAYIEFHGVLSGTALDLLDVSVFSAPPGDLTFALNLATVEMLNALRDKAGSSMPVKFEGEADFYINPSDHTAGTITRKLWSVDVTIAPPLIFPSMAAISEIDWIKPPSDSYVPYTIDQIITGTQNYTQVVGDGATTIFHLDHNLGTANISGVILRENVDGGTLLRFGSDYLLAFDSANRLTISFSQAPANSAIAVIITAAGPTSAFETHTHTIGQIINLNTILSSLGEKVTYLMSLIPKPGTIAPLSGMSNSVTTIPPIGELLPDINVLDSVLSLTSQIVGDSTNPNKATVISGTGLDEHKQKDDASLKKISDEKATAIATISPEIQTLPFSIYPEVIGWRGTLPALGTAGFLDSQFTGAAPSLLSSSNFERELWRITLNENLLCPGRNLQMDWGVALQLLKANCLAEYKMVLETGTYDDPSSVLSITWADAAIFTQNLAITKELAVHSFGAKLANAAGVLTLSYQLYGTKRAITTAIASPNAVFRCRLINLETDNVAPRGYIYNSIVPSNTAAAGVMIAGAKILQN